MSGASEALAGAAMAALDAVAELNGAYEGAPLQAAFPHAIVEAGPERDWSHKSGEGRELRLAVTLRDKGERPARIRRLADMAEAALGGMPVALDGWRLVTFVVLRSHLLRSNDAAWSAVIEYRARMLKE